MEPILGVLMAIWEFIKKNWKGILIIILGLLFFIQCSDIRGLKTETKRLSNNYYAMCDSASMWKTKTGALVTQTRNMEVTIDELNALYDGAKDRIKELNIKIKDLESYQKGVITKTIHDTITLHDTVINNKLYKTGIYSDGCLTVDFEINNDTAAFALNSNDEIDIFISYDKVGKWWQFWLWPREKVWHTTAVSSCPNTSVKVNTFTVKK